MASSHRGLLKQRRGFNAIGGTQSPNCAWSFDATSRQPTVFKSWRTAECLSANNAINFFLVITIVNSFEKVSFFSVSRRTIYHRSAICVPMLQVTPRLQRSTLSSPHAHCSLIRVPYVVFLPTVSPYQSICGVLKTCPVATLVSLAHGSFQTLSCQILGVNLQFNLLLTLTFTCSKRSVPPTVMSL